jgi:hypothetical protein
MVGVFPGLERMSYGRTLKKPAIPTKAAIVKQNTEHQRAAQIKSIGFRTEPTGKRLFTYDIQNTGLATLNLRQARFKTFRDETQGLHPGYVALETCNPPLAD